MRSAAPRERIAWALLAILLLIPIGWGAHQPSSWDVDNIAPGSVLRGMAAHFGPAWFSSYGPIPYLLTAVLYAPLLLAMRLTGELGTPSREFPWGFAHPDVSVTLLVIVARLLTVALALGVALTLARAARPRSGGDARPAGFWVPLLLAGSAAFAYYARTTNVDMHYLFWLGLGFVLAERPGARLSRYATAAACASAAVCCKEQSAPIALAILLAAAWNARGAVGAARGVLAVGAAAALAYAAAWMLPFHLEGWRAHHDFVFHVARYERAYPLTPAGLAALGGRFVRLLPVALGWPVLAALVAALWIRPAARDLGWRALGLGLYLCGFVAPVGYIYPRFLLPLLLIAVPLGARALDAGFVRLPGPAWRALAATALGLALLTGAPNLSAVQLTDTRYVVARWLERRLPAGGLVEIAGNPRFQATPPAGSRVLYTTPDSLRAAPRGPQGDVVLLSSIDWVYFERDSTSRVAWHDPLTRVGGDYSPAIVFAPSRPTGNVLGLYVSPVIHVYVRRGAPAPDTVGAAPPP